MEHIRWTEKSIEFQNLIDNPAIQKPKLVQIGNKSIVVGIKINGQFIIASPCKVYNDQFIATKQEIVLSSKYKGIWKVISKGTSRKEDRIHRLNTKDIEEIYKQDIKNKRLTSRSYICTKDIEAFDLIIYNNDPTIASRQRIVREMKYIEENVEFEICDIGEIEYTPTESERTSQDYIMVSKSKTCLLFALFTATSSDEKKLLRNRVLRSLYCVTKNESYQRYFFLEVNAQPCHIHPIASEGSLELPYLHSTQNLFNYISNYENNTFLYVKLVRGRPPIKAIDCNGYMLFRRTLIGDKIPICHVKDHVISLVNPDLPVKVKLSLDKYKCHSLSDIHKAELQCMQLSRTLLSRDESEIYVTIGNEKTIANYLKSDNNQQQQQQQTSSNTNEKHINEVEIIRNNQISNSKTGNTAHFKQLISIKNFSNNDKIISNQQKIKLTKSIPLVYSVSNKLYQNHGKRLKQNEKSHQIQQTIIQNRPILSSSLSSSTFNNHRNTN